MKAGAQLSEDHEELVKIRQKVEDLEAEARDRWHENKQTYMARVEKALAGSKHRAAIFLAIDGVKSARDIIRELQLDPKSAWRAFEHLRKEGLLKLLANRRGSPVYTKKPWVKELSIDDHVRERFPVAEQPKSQS